jgi:hypothetical protein
MICPFCRKENDAGALVCAGCSRDIAVPESLKAERDELLRKRDLLRDDLMRAKSELDRARRDKQRRSA